MAVNVVVRALVGEAETVPLGAVGRGVLDVVRVQTAVREAEQEGVPVQVTVREEAVQHDGVRNAVGVCVGEVVQGTVAEMLLDAVGGVALRDAVAVGVGVPVPVPDAVGEADRADVHVAEAVRVDRDAEAEGLRVCDAVGVGLEQVRERVCDQRLSLRVGVRDSARV